MSSLRLVPVAAHWVAALALLFTSFTVAFASSRSAVPGEDLPPIARRQFAPGIVEPNPVGRALFRGRLTDWAAVIDSTWGPAPGTVTQQLNWLNEYATALDERFGCFEGFDVNIDSLHALYAAEISAGVSKGRLAAILNHLARSVHESHTQAELNAVNQFTSPAPGVPLLYMGGWGESGHFGAGLTPLPDSTLLVYAAVPSHPLGLVPGDVVLGYEGVPWPELCEELLEAQLPLKGWWWGSSEPSYAHSWLMSAGMNWHLFETIDVLKYGTGLTEHLPTSLLDGQTMEIFCSEQLPIPGVPMPDFAGSYEVVSWGIIDGTNIGYIYVYSWATIAEEPFFDAVSALMDTDGLILDYRMNYGGGINISNQGYSLLFNTTVPTVNFAIRSDPEDHFAMTSAGFDSTDYDIPGDPATYYHKPIAVLVGPGAISSGDFAAHRMTFHPKARFFGKPTSSAFNGYSTVPMNYLWDARFAEYSSYALDDPGDFLTHNVFPVDEEVWLTADDVAQGIDTVVEAAVAWIQAASSIAGPSTAQPVVLQRSYPNPFISTTTVMYSLVCPSHVQLAIYDVRGRRVRTLVASAFQDAGHYELVWNGLGENRRRVAAGVYFAQITAGGESKTTKLVLTR